MVQKERSGLTQLHRNTASGWCILFVLQYHSFSFRIHNNLKKHWPILSGNYPSILEFCAPPLPSYRRGRTIRDRLVRADQFSPPKPIDTFLGPRKTGSFPCLLCIPCNCMIKGLKFSHPHRETDIRIKNYVTNQMSLWFTLCV